MPSLPSPPTILTAPLRNLTILLKAIQSSLSSPRQSNNISEPPNALSVLYDASSLLHAQTTKLSLLLLNKPFTPSAVAGIITSVTSQCLPGLSNAWEVLDARLYSDTLQKELSIQLRALVTELSSLIDMIPCDEKNLAGLERKREEILVATGHIWEKCDRMKHLAGMGIMGLALEKVDTYHALVKDAIEEIEEWDPDEEEGSLFGSDYSESDKPKQNSERQTNGINGKHVTESREPVSLDGLQIQDMHIAKDRALKNLKFLRLLYPALRKRRISSFPLLDRSSLLETLPLEQHIQSLDEVLRFLQGVSEETDEVAGALYGGDAKEAARRLEELTFAAVECLQRVKPDWSGKEDEFSAWSQTWIKRMKDDHLER